MKTVRRKIISIQILAVIVAAHIIDVRLIALVDVVPKEMRVAQLVDHALHLHGQLVQMIVILRIRRRILAGQQRMEDDDRLVQIPDEHALRHFRRIARHSRFGGDAARRTRMGMSATACPARLRGGRGFGGHTAAGVGRNGDRRDGRMGVRQQSGCGGMATENGGGVGETVRGVGSARFGGAFWETGGDLETLATRSR